MAEHDWDDDRLAALRQLADQYGIATDFWDFQGTHRFVSTDTIIKVLLALGVEIEQSMSADRIYQMIESAKLRQWRQVLPPTTVIREGQESHLIVHVPDGQKVWVHLVLEDGSRWDLSQADIYVPPQEVDGVLTGRATFILPSHLPLGYHTAVSEHEDGKRHEAHLFVVPNTLHPKAFEHGRLWGVAAQLYSVLSQWGWGFGDAADLADLGTVCAEQGADFLLINPLHAAEPVAPVSDSPYLPVTRRFVNPQYIRPEWITEVAALTESQIHKLRKLAKSARKDMMKRDSLIHRDRSWTLKMEGLQLIYEAPRTYARQQAFERYRNECGQSLEDFALWCAIEEAKTTRELVGVSYRHDENVEEIAEELKDRVEFFVWLQWIIDEQLAQAQELSCAAGMKMGIMHDLAVGVHPSGSEKWSHPEYFAPGMQVGAPPDMYNQQGQNWSQPPWNPRMLEQTGYRPLREMLQAVLSHAGGVRIDHILGLFRLWWIPQDAAAADGTYVYYNHEAMVGILLLEAHRAGVVVVGEDLGTVEPWVLEYLSSRGILGTSIFWFERCQDGSLAYPDQYRRNALSTINTHDLPPTSGYLEGVHTDLRYELGLLVEDVEKVRAEDAQELHDMRQRMHELGILDREAEASSQEIIAALYEYVARTPSLLTAVSLVDVVGERRAQNQPGTFREYPNWCVPLGDCSGAAVRAEELPTHEGFLRIMGLMREAMNKYQA
ncbi:4-alpha-glucanotransferase [Boudabousia marimammalium]|uniref:4-alpha-glucanotransferase n=1 Tax=Boudabousia marimammalium TaxID=156892 RepID=A0A1Q5PPH8_9ACTO|nr:4-alpha-glucanotransferase [Boudabousia marimammalium]OKL49350.1 4-alpha-glucanotransferase [Boudabousia marimammalium]